VREKKIKPPPGLSSLFPISAAPPFHPGPWLPLPLSALGLITPPISAQGVSEAQKCDSQDPQGAREGSGSSLNATHASSLRRSPFFSFSLLLSYLPPLHRQRLVVPVLPGPVDVRVGVHARAGLHSEGVRGDGRARRRRRRT